MSQIEFQLINDYFRHDSLAFARDGIELGIGDDAAVISVPEKKSLCMSMDVLVEGIHFPANADPFLIGQRCLAVNISDLAAMAAEPLCFTLGIALPRADRDWLEKFRDGLALVARRYNCPLVGGDTVAGSGTIAIQVQGLTRRGRSVTRAGARPGDVIYVTGTLGNGALALAAQEIEVQFDSAFAPRIELLSETDLAYLNTRFYSPEPRVEFALNACHLLHSAIDVSDGLAGDLAHILEASECGAIIEADLLPYAPALRRAASPAECLAAALYGGDDYELCVTVAEESAPELETIAAGLSLQLTRIGEINSSHKLLLRQDTGKLEPVRHRSYSHFQA
ncbi:MAG: thiamine-phosphate kinase [Proteobacteria bacterium]|nr:thiamine-phosphate kinase [Pseudomonadota bacterium]MDA0927680.1 thiamine-phosphate kinase [Pseudomonadota bacterium]